MKATIRKIVVQVDETHLEGGQAIDPPTRRALAMAVIDNPYAGHYSANLDTLIEIGEELGGLLGQRCVQALGITPEQAHSYGKAAIVGEAGELEHAAAILHPKLGAPLRAAVEKGAALVPSAKKQGTLGTAIDVPLGHKDAAFVRSHFDAMEARVADAPRAEHAESEAQATAPAGCGRNHEPRRSRPARVARPPAGARARRRAATGRGASS